MIFRKITRKLIFPLLKINARYLKYNNLYTFEYKKSTYLIKFSIFRNQVNMFRTLDDLKKGSESSALFRLKLLLR